MPNLRRLGQEAEDQAAEFLLQKDYTIITRRYQTRYGELDIVALDGEVLVFVEVKFRNNVDATPELAVDDVKIDRLAKAAEQYAAACGCHGRQTRFDLIAVTPTAIRHHIDAFRPR